MFLLAFSVRSPQLCIVSTTFHAEVFEDNNGALTITTTQRLTPRSKYFLVKYHHFWEAVRDGNVKVSKDETGMQNADFLTKGLPQETFQANRHRVQG